MAKVIDLTERMGNLDSSLIVSRPWEFRRSDREGKYFLQMARPCSEILERTRRECPQRELPAHFVLRGGMAYTIRASYAYREDEEKMREVYYLAGLIDCMINQVSPLLRTDIIRDLYRKIMTLKGLLCVSWYGTLDQVLFPLDEGFFSLHLYRERLCGARSMKALYGIIRQATEEMFDILSAEYVFYIPGRET